MSNTKSKFGVEELPSEVTVLPMSSPDDILEEADGEYTQLDGDYEVYQSESGDHTVLAGVYGANEMIDYLVRAVEGGAEDINIVGVCAANAEEYEPGDLLEVDSVHGLDGTTNYGDRTFIQELDDFPAQHSINYNVEHASVPAVNYRPPEVEEYIRSEGIESYEMEIAAAAMVANGDRVDLEISDERIDDLSVSAAVSVFDLWSEDSMSQEKVWENSEITKGEAWKEASEGAAQLLDDLNRSDLS